MPDLCKVHDLATSIGSCLDVAGLKQVKILKSSEVDLDTINGALSTYFDTANYTFKNIALPLIGGGDGWQVLEHDAAGARRTATSPTGKSYFDINISALRFQGFQNTLSIAQMKRSSANVTATLLQGGTIILDGLTYDPDLGEVVIDASLNRLKIGEVVEDSSAFDDEIGLHTLVQITGRTQHKGYKFLGAWTLVA